MNNVKDELRKLCVQRNPVLNSHNIDVYQLSTQWAYKLHDVTPEQAIQRPQEFQTSIQESACELREFVLDLCLENMYKHDTRHPNNYLKFWDNNSIKFQVYLWQFKRELKHMSQQVETLENVNSVLENKVLKMSQQVETLENVNSVLENKVLKMSQQVETLEKYRCLFTDKNVSANIIKRYWRKYVLIKRISEASKIYNLTKNFSNFVDPVTMMKNVNKKEKWSVQKAEQIAKDWLN
jgi:hypothetical protein